MWEPIATQSCLDRGTARRTFCRTELLKISDDSAQKSHHLGLPRHHRTTCTRPHAGCRWLSETSNMRGNKGQVNQASDGLVPLAPSQTRHAISPGCRTSKTLGHVEEADSMNSLVRLICSIFQHAEPAAFLCQRGVCATMHHGSSKSGTRPLQGICVKQFGSQVQRPDSLCARQKQ